MTYTVSVNGHEVEIWLSIWSGKERISYDGKVVSEKRSFRFETVHSFEAEEDGEKVIYEVIVKTGFVSYGYTVRRNGVIQAHKP